MSYIDTPFYVDKGGEAVSVRVRHQAKTVMRIGSATLNADECERVAGEVCGDMNAAAEMWLAERMKDMKSEIDSLRRLVKDLSDALNNLTCHADCMASQNDACDDDCFHIMNRALVARAEEAVK